MSVVFLLLCFWCFFAISRKHALWLAGLLETFCEVLKGKHCLTGQKAGKFFSWYLKMIEGDFCLLLRLVNKRPTPKCNAEWKQKWFWTQFSVWEWFSLISFCLHPVFSFTFNNSEIRTALMSLPGSFLHAPVWLTGKHEAAWHGSSIAVSVGWLLWSQMAKLGHCEGLPNGFLRPFTSNSASAELNQERHPRNTYAYHFCCLCSCFAAADWIWFSVESILVWKLQAG